MLETMVWARDSPLYYQLAECDSPRPPRYDALLRPDLRKSLQVFFRKIYHLASFRIRKLAGMLIGVSPVEIWTVFEHVMTDHLHLFHDRHIDQIMLSSTYLISKAKGRGITFRRIIESYRQLPHVQNKQDVYRNVPLRTSPLPQMLMCSCESTISKESSDTGNIIEFYNYVFLSHMSTMFRPAKDYEAKLRSSAFQSHLPPSYLSSPGKYYHSEALLDKTSFIDPHFFGEIPGNKSVEKPAIFIFNTGATTSRFDHDFPTNDQTGPEKSAGTGIKRGPEIRPPTGKKTRTGSKPGLEPGS